MKILFVITRAETIAGAQRHVFELSNELIRDGSNVQVVCGEGEAFTSLLSEHDIPFTVVKKLKRPIRLVDDFICIIELRKIIREIKPDIVSLHSSKAGLVGRIAAVGLECKVIFTAHGWSFTDGVGRFNQVLCRYIERVLSLITDRIICVSDYDRKIALNGKMNAERIITIHNGRHDNHNPARINGSTDLKPIPVVLMIGRLDDQKDHESLFKALAQFQEFRLVLVGDGPKKSHLESLAENLGIDQKVEFKGLLLDVTDELENSDIFCLITNWEGFPRSTLEAMSFGLPVVVSNVGGTAEAVKKGLTGFVVDRGDVVGVKEALQYLIENPGMAKQMGQNGRELFLEKFTFEKMYISTRKVYDSFL